MPCGVAHLSGAVWVQSNAVGSDFHSCCMAPSRTPGSGTLRTTYAQGHVWCERTGFKRDPSAAAQAGGVSAGRQRHPVWGSSWTLAGMSLSSRPVQSATVRNSIQGGSGQRGGAAVQAGRGEVQCRRRGGVKCSAGEGRGEVQCRRGAL